MASSKQSIFFDGDDTLWKTQTIYKSVMDEFYDQLAQQGFAIEEARTIFATVNEEFLKTIKLSTERLGRSMSVTYETMCQRAGISSSSAISKRLVELAREVYTRAPEPMEDLHTVLNSLLNDFVLFFYSGSNEETQRNRLKTLALEQYFQNRVYIVAQKDEITLKRILDDCRVEPQTTWMIGNSPRFDVNPALSIGLNSIWMHTNFWKLDLEDIKSERTFVAFSLNEISNILMQPLSLGRNYSPLTSETLELQTAASQYNGSDIWIIGNSPKLDINPALFFGFNTIWMPTDFSADDIEPIIGSVFVAFSKEGAEYIIKERANGNPEIPRVFWRLRQMDGNRGQSMVVD